MRVHKIHFERLRSALAASVVALLAAASALAAEAAQPAASRYVPTTEDYLGVYDALQNYRFGVEKHDQKALDSAFWEDAVRIAVPTPGGPEMNARNAGQSGPNAGPPPGSNARPPGPGGATPNASGGDGVEVWHLPLDSYIHFESATRATHYEYFLSIYPQPEKKAEEGKRISNTEARTSIAGWPGHYEDTLEKRHGEWRISHRKTMINQ